jgi:acetyltransferase-like isoleucine patch superfamily enzyme
VSSINHRAPFFKTYNASRAPGAAAENWLESQRRFSYDSRTQPTQPLGDGLRYAPLPVAPSDEPPFPAGRYAPPNHHGKARAGPSSSQFAPSIISDTNGGSLSHSSGGASTSLGSAFDTPRGMITTRIAMKPPLGPFYSAGPSEKDNMLNGRDYRHFTDPELLNDRAWCKQAIERYNKAAKSSFDIDMDGRMRLFRQILQPDRLLRQGDSRNHPIGTIGSKILIEAPFKCEYGYNVHIADNVVIQAGCVIYDPCPITIGRGTIIGPNVKFYGLGPDTRLDARVRNGSEGKLRGGKIMVEEDCFIGGDVVILPNVIIGRECVIEPGTVVSGVSTKQSPLDFSEIILTLSEHTTRQGCRRQSDENSARRCSSTGPRRRIWSSRSGSVRKHVARRAILQPRCAYGHVKNTEVRRDGATRPGDKIVRYFST